MASCENVQHLQSFLSGTLSDADVSVVEVHLETCAECQAALETICSKNENVAHQVIATPNVGDSEWSDDVAKRLLQGVQSASVGASADRDGAEPTNVTAGNVDETMPPKRRSETPPVSLAETAAPADTRPRAPSSASGEIPEQFGRYRIVKTLGKGGMGAVYLAEDADLDRQVAIKVPFINDDDQDALDRFRREARSVAQIQHANICPVYDVSQFEGTHYMTMAFVEGKPLSDYVRPGKPLKIKQVVKLVQILAKALAFAHEAGIIHRDLKPANIMMSKRGQPIIMDFGLARREGKDDTQLTKSGQIMGTPSYMPPEQVAGRLEIMGPGCDIYSLGVIMFQLLTGEVPFQGDLLAVLSQIAMQKPTPPSEKRPGIDSELDAICLKALEKQPEDRFQSMSEFAGTLADYAKGKSQTDVGETTMSASGEHLPTASNICVSLFRVAI